MSMLGFIRLPSIFDGQLLWRANSLRYSYVISKELDERDYLASAKPVGIEPFKEGREDLGAFPTFEKAIEACHLHLSHNV